MRRKWVLYQRADCHLSKRPLLFTRPLLAGLGTSKAPATVSAAPPPLAPTGGARIAPSAHRFAPRLDRASEPACPLLRRPITVYSTTPTAAFAPSSSSSSPSSSPLSPSSGRRAVLPWLSSARHSKGEIRAARACRRVRVLAATGRGGCGHCEHGKDNPQRKACCVNLQIQHCRPSLLGHLDFKKHQLTPCNPRHQADMVSGMHSCGTCQASPNT